MTVRAVFPRACESLRSIEEMFFWFFGTATVAVWFVFRDDRFDHRVLALGAILPDLVDAPTGGMWVAHSVTASVALLGVVMAATVGRREMRRRWLALPIGTFLHLVFDGAFSDTTAFWWPFAGLSTGAADLPSLSRGWWNIVLEAAGLAMIYVMAKRHGLDSPVRRREFVATGRLVDPGAGEVGKC